MGLKTTNYTIEDKDITIANAYAKIGTVSVTDTTAYCDFIIQQSREETVTKTPLEIKSYDCTIDKTQPIYEQLYTGAKTSLFVGWEDDIVEE